MRTARLIRRAAYVAAAALVVTAAGCTGDTVVDGHPVACGGERVVGPDGHVCDTNRTAYLRDHLRVVRDALAEGLDIRGYFCWSLLDNFEWAAGFHKRFGLIRCDYPTQQRTIKASGLWYAKVAESNGMGIDDANE